MKTGLQLFHLADMAGWFVPVQAAGGWKQNGLPCADTSRGVLLTEAAGPAPEQLQPASMGQPDEILESLERGYLDEPGAKTTSPAGAAAAAPS